MNARTSADIYRFEVDADSDTAAANVLRFVGKGKRVLEIGAGPGSIARPLAEINGCRMSALELDEASVAILREFCDTVVRHDLNDPTWPDAVPERDYDALVIADVLEHLYDPWETLRRAAGLIRGDGSVVVSIPHASHATILGCLAGNDFTYRDWGLLDRTHIRFFSMKNIQALFEGAGLKIAEFAYVIRRPEETELAEAWSALPKRTRDVLELGEFAHVYQVVVRAVRAGHDPERPGLALDVTPALRSRGLNYVAFYLPQFHPIPENDRWWGRGFTEWTNVTKAAPLFPGHYQPHLPADLGFYDLRLREAQRAQIEVARHAGIDAFCFHYYWFGGKKLLERPLEDFLRDSEANFGFCLCWANENWTRKWNASEHEVLMMQVHSPEDDLAFIEELLPLFRDRRYVRVNGAPVLIVYRPQQLPDPVATAGRWRQRCREAGIGEIHLVAALTRENRSFEQFGFDAGVEFPPHNMWVQNFRDEVGSPTPLDGLVVEYGSVARQFLGSDYTDRRVYRCVVPSWDNTARMGHRSLIMLDGVPDNYERWLDAASRQTIAERPAGERLVFINAWNEWAEGCHLEPDQRFGHGFLEATRRAKSGHTNLDPAFVSRERQAAAPAAATDEVTHEGFPPPGRAATEQPASATSHRVGLLATWSAGRLARFPRAYRITRAFYRVTRQVHSQLG